ncbi:LPP20 family lipoprotein [Alkalimarinus sediminis]|uniref:LPP20 family lipoprotein n=1 Tax=Alkalimarinus sediminis TaxID=1632866 RepID=A0A9E8HNU9_9ALTE|nr:LPP20 family lipoprotein [Alkalimarinus sediminis]UZW73736.1 LPP20 family lipoprotein [Alkalimarinus sediminis]
MKYFLKLTLMMLMVSFLSSCAGTSDNESEESSAHDALPPILIRVSGYGTYEHEKDRLSERKRLMAMRASRLDAYRALAERVYGTVIFGSSTVSDFVLQDDNYRTMVDSVIRGAKVVTVTEHKGGTFETVVELMLESRFRECLSHVNHFRYNEDCRLPLPHGNDSSGDISVSSKSNDSLYYLK